MSRADLDLKVAAAIALVAWIVATTTDSVVLRAVPCALLVLFVPGYVLSVALLPARRDIFERCLLGFGLSLCVDVLGGLVLDRLGVGLTARSWSTGLALFTFAACLVARHRRRTMTDAPITTTAGPDHREARNGRRILLASAMVAGSLAAVVGAIVVARSPANSAHIEGSTSLWINPVDVATGRFVVGVRSDELRPTSYRVVATSRIGSTPLIDKTLTLAPGRQWRASGKVVVPRPGVTEQVQVVLYRTSRPRVVYRHVNATFGATGP